MEVNMDELMYSIANLRSMELIDISSGTKIGFMKDLIVDCSEYKIVSIVITGQKASWFGKNDDIEIPWERVKKIGYDIILIDGTDIVPAIEK